MKQAKAFADLMKQAFPSPFKQACRKWRETTKRINKRRENEHKRTG